MNARNVHRNMLRVRRLVRAFTLVEMLITVGAVALIAVGLGKLFSSTGDTVRIGRRLSYLNEMATTIENRIRRDLAAATRDGPMVIRNKVAAGGTALPLSPDDRNPAPRTDRRIDEIMFLASGQFTTSREPQWPGRSPSSSVARIYIGHGMARDANDVTTPKLDDDPEGLVAATWPPDFGAAGPNQYPSSWILLRHVTVLARPQTTQYGQSPTSFGGQEIPTNLTSNNWQDSPTQKDLQPAAPSVFRLDPTNKSEPDRLGWGYQTWSTTTPAVVSMSRLPTPNSAVQWLRKNDTSVNAWPSCASGLVDIVTMDPPMIRNRILGVPQRLPFDASSNAQYPPKMALMLPLKASLESTNYDVNPNANPAHLQKMLMASMLPGADPWIYQLQNTALATPTVPLNAQREKRMICAPKPPNFSGTRSATGAVWPSDEPYRQQDQAMLSASNLIVGCSNFKVEWSFGDVYPLYDDALPTRNTVNAANAYAVGQVIWHGLEESTPNPGELPTKPYRGSERHIGMNASGDQATGYDAHYQSWVHRDNGVLLPRSIPFPARLLHWPTSVVDPNLEQDPNVPLYSFFGYLDPTFKPSVVNGAQVDPDTLEWPWPKLLRFTIGLTDPADPTFEQTYQFIVEVPAATQRQ